MTNQHLSYFNHPNYYNVPHTYDLDYNTFIIIEQVPTLANLALKQAFNSQKYTYDDWLECCEDEGLSYLYLQDKQKYFIDYQSACFFKTVEIYFLNNILYVIF